MIIYDLVLMIIATLQVAGKLWEVESLNVMDKLRARSLVRRWRRRRRLMDSMM